MIITVVLFQRVYRVAYNTVCNPSQSTPYQVVMINDRFLKSRNVLISKQSKKSVLIVVKHSLKGHQ